jgi:hypothetical protein
MTKEQILSEIKKLPLEDQASLIRSIEAYKQKIADELDLKPEKEYYPCPQPVFVRHRPYWTDIVWASSGTKDEPLPRLDVLENSTTYT